MLGSCCHPAALQAAPFPPSAAGRPCPPSRSQLSRPRPRRHAPHAGGWVLQPVAADVQTPLSLPHACRHALQPHLDTALQVKEAKKICPELVLVHVETIGADGSSEGGTGDDAAAAAAAGPAGTAAAAAAAAGGGGGGQENRRLTQKACLERYRCACPAGTRLPPCPLLRLPTHRAREHRRRQLLPAAASCCRCPSLQAPNLRRPCRPARRRRSTAEVLVLLHRLAPSATIEKASIDEVYSEWGCRWPDWIASVET